MTATKGGGETVGAGVTDEMVEAACLAYWPKHWPTHFRHEDTASIRGHMRSAIAAALASPPTVGRGEATINLRDPMVILAGIKQFGLASDGSDLRDLEAALAALSQRNEARETDVVAGWNACRRSIYAVCEDVQNEAERLRTTSKPGTASEEQHAKGYYAGTCYAAKSIARGFNSTEALDDNFVRDTLATLPEAWLSMDIAPKDGTRVLVRMPGKPVAIAHYIPQSWQWSNRYQPTGWLPLPTPEQPAPAKEG